MKPGAQADTLIAEALARSRCRDCEGDGVLRGAWNGDAEPRERSVGSDFSIYIRE